MRFSQLGKSPSPSQLRYSNSPIICECVRDSKRCVTWEKHYRENSSDKETAAIVVGERDIECLKLIASASSAEVAVGIFLRGYLVYP